MTTRSVEPMAHPSERSAARFGHDTHTHTGRGASNHSTVAGPHACGGSVTGATAAAALVIFSSLTFVEPTDRSPSPAGDDDTLHSRHGARQTLNMVSKQRALCDVAQMVRHQGLILASLTARQAAEGLAPRGPSIEALVEMAKARGCRDERSAHTSQP